MFELKWYCTAAHRAPEKLVLVREQSEIDEYSTMNGGDANLVPYSWWFPLWMVQDCDCDACEVRDEPEGGS